MKAFEGRSYDTNIEVHFHDNKSNYFREFRAVTQTKIYSLLHNFQPKKGKNWIVRARRKPQFPLHLKNFHKTIVNIVILH